MGSASNDVEESISDGRDEDSDNYMMGPMIVRVRTDGSPIPGDDHQRTHLPKDEDMEEHMAMRSRTVPSVSELQEFFSPPSPQGPTSTSSTTTRRANLYLFYDRLKVRQPVASYAYA